MTATSGNGHFTRITWQRCITEIPPQILQPKAETVSVVKPH